ncbi:MAG TPA: hypothetical protein VJR27_04740 [Candidatus Saccharimonadales bacterium]|nr:hypothetical protein [Candidatus Saccharimonadales bacterium]
MEQCPLPELPFEGIELVTDMSQHWRLLEIQQAHSEILHKEGMLVRALIQAQYMGNDIPEDAAYRTCVARRFDATTGVVVGGAIRFIGEGTYLGKFRPFTVDVPVFATLVDADLEARPFVAHEAALVHEMLDALAFEREFGELPALGDDLATLPFFPI